MCGCGPARLSYDSESMSTRAITRKPRSALSASRRDSSLTPRVRKTIDAMVFQGRNRDEAARQAGLTEGAIYQALRKPAVLAFYNEQLEVLRHSERARNLHKGIELRDGAASEKVQLEAAKWLHGESGGHGTQVNVGVQVVPGYVIDLREPDA